MLAKSKNMSFEVLKKSLDVIASMGNPFGLVDETKNLTDLMDKFVSDSGKAIYKDSYNVESLKSLDKEEQKLFREAAIEKAKKHLSSYMKEDQELKSQDDDQKIIYKCSGTKKNVFCITSYTDYLLSKFIEIIKIHSFFWVMISEHLLPKGGCFLKSILMYVSFFKMKTSMVPNLFWLLRKTK